MSLSISQKNKGQASLEFLVMLFFVLLVFASFYTLFLDKKVEVQRRRERYQAEIISDGIRYHLSFALAQGTGFSNNFTLPDRIQSNEYNISLTVNQGTTSIFVDYEDGEVFSEVPSEVIGNLSPGECKVENREGVLYVS